MPNSILFKSWTPEEAWLAGLIWADGCLFDDRGTQRVQISTTDEEIAQQVSDITGCSISSSERVGNRKRYYRLGFSSFQPVSRLVSMGLQERKSKCALWPQIPGELPSFVRGYFDGDGTIYRDAGQLRVAIVGSDSFLLGMERAVRFECEFKQRSLTETASGMFLLRFDSRQDVDRLYEFMYQPQRPCLERKRKKFISNQV